MAIAVLPVWRSPIISSRCPRPIGIMASTAFNPVCNGWLTGWRKMTPGALRSNGISQSSPPISPLPSRGAPSGSITRPSMLSPTMMEAIRLVRFTVNPSLIRSVGPSNTAPTLSSSRFITMALMPFSNSSSSFASALRSPYIRATPSLTWSTVPISSSWTRVSMPSSCLRKTSETSLTFMFSEIILLS